MARRLGLGGLVRADLRQHAASFAGVAVAVFVASALVTGLGVLVESGARGGMAPERYTHVDVVVGGVQAVDVPEDLPIPLRERVPLPDDAAAAIAAVDGVDRIVGDVTVPLSSSSGALVEAHPWASTELTGLELGEGNAPAAPDEVVVTPATGESIGATVSLAHGGVSAEYRVVGIVEGASASQRAPHVFLSAERIAQLDPHGGEPRVLGVFADGGKADAEAVAAAIRDAVPGVDVRTGDARGDVEFLDAGAARATLIAIGSAFVGTCILVALFIVAGTLSLSVQARRRDFALLRAVGATPKQIHALVTREVLTVASVAGVLGIVPGYLFSSALQSAFVSGGVIPGDFALAVSASPAAGALLLVLGAAWGAARIAAGRPARLDPIEALRESSSGPSRIGLPRAISGILLAVAGVSVSTVPLVVHGEDAAAISVAAALLLFVALALLGPLLVSAVVRAAGSVLRRGSAAGFLAAANGRANSRRLSSAILPIALGIGLGLVQIGAAGIVENEAAVQAEVGVTADLRVSAPVGLSGSALETIASTAGVTAASPVVIGAAAVDHRDLEGDPTTTEFVLQGVDPSTVDGAIDLGVREGSISQLDGETEVAVSTDAARTLGVGIGDAVDGHFGDGAPWQATVVAVYERGLGFGALTMDVAAVRAHTTTGLDAFALVSAESSSVDDVRVALEQAGFSAVDGAGPRAAGAETRSQQGWVSLIGLIVILGYIAIAVVNTLVMATRERSRELALLQLIGASRGQVRAMMRHEAVLIALTSAVFGVAVAIPPLVGASMGVSGTLIPALPLLPAAVIVAGMSALALVSVGAATIAALRTRPIEEIGSRQ
ncbi:ABC transporter permease [Streptomyces sp. AC495_CC817]|uniref:ABC transporter permease n=1 Tax=Streptomyces sp. AC495_CC817 TaxID=2823900 RepID=UPI001C277DE3|nr:ABC transporter permease [Streptomyces sp. AC495_CC817]